MKPEPGWLHLGTFLVALAIAPNLEAAKPGGGGGKTEIRFARIQLDPFDAVRSDGIQGCYDPGDPFAPSGMTWDYWDWRDTSLAGCDAGSTADVSGGGRLHFNTINLQGGDGPPSSPRWLVLDFNRPGNPVWGAADPNIDSLYEGGITDPPKDSTPGIDNVKAVVILENMFKAGVTRDSLVITIRNCDDPSQCSAVPTGYSLVWVEDLYIQDTTDPNVRILTTDDTSAQADLFFDHDNTPKTPPIHVGRYVMPIHWTLRIVPSP